MTKQRSDFDLVHFNLDGARGLLSKNGRPVDWVRLWPGLLGTKSITWMRLARLLQKYIQRKDKYSYALFHATNQTLSLAARRNHPSIVTIHDIIEVLQPQTKGLGMLARYLYSGIPKADCVVCVSQYTARTVQDYYGVPESRIAVIPNGVGDEFHPIEDFESTVAYQTLRQRLKLSKNNEMVLYVGSDHPRKNLKAAIRVFARVLRFNPNLVFIKVGEAGLASGREELLGEIDRLGVRDAVRMLGHVSNEQLNELYNLAGVLLYPSRFEGFGLPPLQAMAAGTPVITSNATALPEVVGKAALVHDPDDIDGMAADLVLLLKDEQVAGRLRAEGFAQARMFSWERSAKLLTRIYQRLCQ